MTSKMHATILMQINILQVLDRGCSEFLPDKTQYLSLICLVLEAKFIFSKLDSLIESLQCINLSELN